MPKIIVLPHEELCPDGAVLEAETGETVLNVMTLGLSTLVKKYVHALHAMLLFAKASIQ